MKKIVWLSILIVSCLAVAQDETHKAQMKVDRDAVDQACQADAQMAGCGDKKITSGLRKCLFAYHKDHPDFKLSSGCKSAMKKLHDDRTQH